jgi:uncharacterized 2Fe-2S/4Fe-4S cluster protein (DUF4445 family)
MKHFNITFKPDDKQISIHAGATLTEAAGQAGIILNTICGGKGICRKCLVTIEPDAEQVLACQYRIQKDITITIPPESRFFEQKILEQGIDIQNRVRPVGYPEKTDAKAEIFGLAVDIGTTTVVAKLINMADTRCIATQSALNPQSQYGDDCLSRIAYVQTDQNLIELQKLIIDCINDLTAKLCKQASINHTDICEICVVGNTTMNHIFLKFPVTQLGQAPYNAFSTEAKDSSPEQLPLHCNRAANIHTPANIAGFVGSDTTAVALATDINSAEEMTLIVDIGTNGEIVLGTKDKLYAASCAAGPAFEGARITCGSRATAGAIETVLINNGDIDIDVIGDCPPRSICGSGLIDALAVLLDLGVVDNTGRFVERQNLRDNLSPAIFSRLTEHNDQPAFVLAQNTDTNEPKVILTQKDIRQIQLAKAAIRAGIKLLQKRLGLDDPDIKHIFLAGAFGNYIRAESAMRIELLPHVPQESIYFVGNAAASGAHMILLSRQWRQLAVKLAERIEYVEIAHEPDFIDVYTDCMSF